MLMVRSSVVEAAGVATRVAEDMAKRLTGNELSGFNRLWHDSCGKAIIEAQHVD
jgi:hypothetical protein